MAKVFTITEGLENMGALKTGGQGSVYKARRYGEIITAVKLLPTPIQTESPEDRHFMDFSNEVSKLKKVNEKPNPNVVKILSSGITETGSFPFIEMEFIEGPDLEELLKPPHEPVFTIKEAVRVAEDLSNALAHCHRVDVKHGDIKTNNIKYNIHSAHYVLLDFGMAIMSDEQRRTSMRQAGAIEFMAPEQNTGQMLFQTDVYSFGIVLFELLAGTVPFPLKDRSETSRNDVMVAHLENKVPDLLQLREEHMPESWPPEKRAEQMQVPAWLVKTIYRCLEKKPADRFANGIELHNQVVYNRVSSFADHDLAAKALTGIQKENEKLRNENRLLRRNDPSHSKAGVNKILAALLLIVSVAFLGYFIQSKKNTEDNIIDENEQTVITPRKSLGQYIVRSARAYFHNEPDDAARRNVFMVPSNDVVMALDDKNGFIYTEFTNAAGQFSKGWLKKSDLQMISSQRDSSAINIQPNNTDVDVRLEDAATLLATGQVEQAVNIYKQLAASDVQGAVYHLGNLGLKKKIDDLDCASSWNYLEQSSQKGYAPAKRTLGFLLVFADNRQILAANEYENCSYQRNVFEGTRLLREAAAEGDSLAKTILSELSQ